MPSVNPNGDASKADKKDLFAKFSVENMRIDPARSAVKTTTVRTGMFCGSPRKQSWFRVSPNPDHCITVKMLELETSDGQSELYACTKDGAEHCTEGFVASLFLAIHKDETPFLFMCKEPVGEKWDSWYISKREVAEAAKTKWLRYASDKHSGTYTITYPETQFPDPVFPTMDMGNALYLCFKGGRLIEDSDHPALRALRGAE